MELMAEQLLLSLDTVFRVEDAQLNIIQQDIDLGIFLCQSISSAIMIQYDRLDSTFKFILRVACIMGQVSKNKHSFGVSF
jgi:hypothetical protein